MLKWATLFLYLTSEYELPVFSVIVTVKLWMGVIQKTGLKMVCYLVTFWAMPPPPLPLWWVGRYSSPGFPKIFLYPFAAIPRKTGFNLCWKYSVAICNQAPNSSGSSYHYIEPWRDKSFSLFPKSHNTVIPHITRKENTPVFFHIHLYFF